MSKKELKILLISDIHFDSTKERECEDTHEQSGAVYSFIGLIDFFQSTKAPRIDYVVVNGDIANRNVKEDFVLAKEYFKKLLKIKSKIPPIDRWVFSCGNHDLDRKELTNRETKTPLDELLFNNELIKNSNNELEIPRVLTNDNIKKRNNALDNEIHLFKKSYKYFIDFLNELGVDIPPFENKYVDNRNLPKWIKYLTGKKIFKNDEIEFNILNSSWYCTGKNELGNLLLGKKISSFVNENIEDNIKITCIHHGHNWYHWSENHLSKDSFSSNLNVIEKNSDIIITGHQHTPTPLHPTRLHSKTLVIEGGALFEHADYPNSFKIININKKNRNLTIDNYTSTKRNDGYDWTDNHYDDKVYELDYVFKKRKSKEDSFWEDNLNIEISKEDLREYLKSNFERKFNINLDFIKEHKKGNFLFKFKEINILFLKLSTEKGFNNNIDNIYSNQIVNSNLIVVPFYKIDNNSFFKELIDEKIEVFNLVKSKIREKQINIMEVDYVTKKEIKDEKRNKYVRQKIKYHLESNHE